MDGQKGLVPLLIIVLMAIVIILIPGIYFLVTRYSTYNQQSNDLQLIDQSLKSIDKINPSPSALVIDRQAPVIEEQPASTKGWTILLNSTYNYSFEYPTGWYRIPDSNTLRPDFLHLANNKVQSEKIQDNKTLMISAWVETYSQRSNELEAEIGTSLGNDIGSSTKIADLLFNGYRVIKVAYENLDEYTIESYFIKLPFDKKSDQEIYIVNISAKSKSLVNQNLDIYQKVLDSFRILK